MAEAVLGQDAEIFLAGEIGRYILGRCDEDIAEAHRLLAHVSPWRRDRIRQLQNQVWRAQSMKDWLAELIVSGRQAAAVLDED
jgi:hypothetical protein